MSINITKQTSKIPWYILIIGILGILLRTWHLFFISFAAPFHLGGLYYEFSRQIIVNNFALPHNIPFYSPGGLPFIYPPLSFYIQAIVLKLFSPSNFLTVDLLPPLLTALSVPLFYWMILRFTEDPRLQAAALFAFAFMPSAFVNQIEGAGLAEACGTLALLAYLGILFDFLKKPGLLNAFLAGIFLGLSVLSSPGSAYGAVIISLIFFLVGLWKNIKDRSFRISALLLMTALTGLVISSPYWLTIILHGEVGIFVNAFSSQHANGAILNQIRYLITFKPADMILFVSDEGVYGFLFDWLILAGLIWAVLNKNGMTVVLFFLFWLIPRLGSWLVAIPGALLAGLGIVHLVWPLFQKAFSNHKVGQNLPLMPGILLLMLVLVIIASPILAVHDMLNRVELQFTPEKVAALRAEQTVIPSDAHVLVVGNGSLIEWAPALLQREVVNCQFGLEWKPKDLQEVYRINDALAMHDLAKAMTIIHAYTGDTMVWLVGEPALFTKLEALNDPSLVVAIQDRSSELILATIQIK